MIPRRAFYGLVAGLVAFSLAVPSVAAAAQPTLTVNLAGTGEGSVECEAGSGPVEPCQVEYASGTELTLLPEAVSGSEFVGFSAGSGSASACAGTASCSFTITTNSAVTATFQLKPLPEFALTITKQGTGTGTVECQIRGGVLEPCAAKYPQGTELILLEVPGPESEFGHWSGACLTYEELEECELTMEGARSVTATFRLWPALTLNISGSGSVTCEAEEGEQPCAARYPRETELVLRAKPNAGSEFKEGTGACTGSGTCQLTMSAAQTVGAKFNLEPTTKFKLTVSKSGTGTGTVKGGSVAEPNTINCGSGSGCEHEYLSGAVVTLTHEAAAGSEFKEWTGACTGSGSCEVTMSAAKSVGAKFDLISKPKFKLTVSKSGTGSGTVTSNPAGINCGSTCAAEFEEGKQVELTQSAASGSEFKEWTGACTGSGACKVTMSEAKAVGAVFNAKSSSGGGGSTGGGGTGGGGGTPPPPAAGTASAAGTATVRSGKAALKLTCSGGPCRGSLTLSAKLGKGGSAVFGRASFSLAAGASTTLRVGLSPAAKRTLATRGALRAALAGTGLLPATVRLKPAGGARKVAKGSQAVPGMQKEVLGG